MTPILKATVVALVLAAGAVNAHAGDVLKDGAAYGRFVTTGGIFSGR